MKREIGNAEANEKKIARNMDNYKTRHEAYLAFRSLKKPPYWFEDDGVHAYIAVDFHEWIWLPIQDNPAYPVEWRKTYVEGNDGEEEAANEY